MTQSGIDMCPLGAGYLRVLRESQKDAGSLADWSLAEEIEEVVNLIIDANPHEDVVRVRCIALAQYVAAQCLRKVLKKGDRLVLSEAQIIGQAIKDAQEAFSEEQLTGVLTLLEGRFEMRELTMINDRLTQAGKSTLSMRGRQFERMKEGYELTVELVRGARDSLKKKVAWRSLGKKGAKALILLSDLDEAVDVGKKLALVSKENASIWNQ